LLPECIYDVQQTHHNQNQHHSFEYRSASANQSRLLQILVIWVTAFLCLQALVGDADQQQLCMAWKPWIAAKFFSVNIWCIQYTIEQIYGAFVFMTAQKLGLMQISTKWWLCTRSQSVHSKEGLQLGMWNEQVLELGNLKHTCSLWDNHTNENRSQRELFSEDLEELNSSQLQIQIIWKGHTREITYTSGRFH
jgi:hypothetical protein